MIYCGPPFLFIQSRKVTCVEPQDQKDRAYRRMVIGRAQRDGVQLPADSVAREKYPTLWEFLTTRYPDQNHVVEPARLSIGLGMGCWIITVSHSDYRTKLEASAATLDEAFAAWELAATASDAPWKTWGKGEITLRKRRKEENP